MQPSIRPAKPGDEAGIVETVKQVYDEYGFTWEAAGYHADLYDVDAHYFKFGHKFWVAELDGQIIGTAALEMFEPWPGPEATLVAGTDNLQIAGCDCALQRLYVRPSARQAGLGTALFGEVLKESRARARHALEIWSDKRFEAAHRLYERFGARIVGERICDDPDRAPEWGLILSL